MIKQLAANKHGRDFVCGDIHGSFSCVERFLEGINFQPEDRLICAGDLVDRGPENEKCLDLLYEPWFESVKGNHEALMEAYYARQGFGEWWAPNGGGWGTQYRAESSDKATHIRDTITELVTKLPYLITVEKKGGGRFHVLHAELHCGYDEVITDETLSNWDTMKAAALANDSNGEMIIWGRYAFGPMCRVELTDRMVGKIRRGAEMGRTNRLYNPALSHIYSGHTTVQKPVTFYGQTNLDTQAFGSYRADAPAWNGLTITEPETGKFWLVNDRTFTETSPVIIN